MSAPRLPYRDVAVFLSEISDGYANSKLVVEEADVRGIMLQATGEYNADFQSVTNATNSMFYPDQDNAFVVSNWNRLEGMVLACSPYGAPEDISWYKVERCRVNRDHLLGNKIDNIQLLLTKTHSRTMPIS